MKPNIAPKKYSFRKLVVLSCLSILISVSSMAFIFEIVLRSLPVRSATKKVDVNSSQPIAKLQPNNMITYSFGWNLRNVIRHRINNDGFANRKDYRLNLKPTIAVIGDSYVEAFQVHHEKSFHGLLQDAFLTKCNVYSFGISGAPLSQYIAWAKYAKQMYAPTFLVINIVGNDFDESYRGYKDTLGFWHYQGRPDEEFEYTLTPMKASLFKRIARQSALARYLVRNVNLTNGIQEFLGAFSRARNQNVYVGNKNIDFDDEKLTISEKVVDRFFEDIIGEIDLPEKSIIFTIDALRQTIYGKIPRNVSDQSYVGVLRSYFIRKAKELGFTTIDLHKSFDENYRRNGKKFEFPYDWHWNEHGHSVVFSELIRLDWNVCR